MNAATIKRILDKIHDINAGISEVATQLDAEPMEPDLRRFVDRALRISQREIESIMRRVQYALDISASDTDDAC